MLMDKQFLGFLALGLHLQLYVQINRFSFRKKFQTAEETSVHRLKDMIIISVKLLFSLHNDFQRGANPICRGTLHDAR